MGRKAKFDINDIKSVQLNLLDSQVDLILNALMFYKYNLEYVASMFSESEEERITELSKVIYTYEQINSSKVEQLYSEDDKTNGICLEEIDNIEMNLKPNITLNSTEESILNLIKSKKYITQKELSKLLSLSENCIYKNLKILKAKGIIERMGSNKNGYWKILNLKGDKKIEN